MLLEVDVEPRHAAADGHSNDRRQDRDVLKQHLRMILHWIACVRWPSLDGLAGISDHGRVRNARRPVQRHETRSD